jgi:hypothetical protein
MMPGYLNDYHGDTCGVMRAFVATTTSKQSFNRVSDEEA